jgi:peroxidase
MEAKRTQSPQISLFYFRDLLVIEFATLTHYTHAAAIPGAHAIGKSHCPSMARRLRNFTAHHDSDPTLDRAYADRLRRQCRSPRDRTTELEMVPGSSETFDAAYYGLVAKRRGLFHSDEALLRNEVTRGLVLRYRDAEEALFLRDFGASMVNMGRVGVLTGGQGEIRRRCAFAN